MATVTMDWAAPSCAILSGDAVRLSACAVVDGPVSGGASCLSTHATALAAANSAQAHQIPVVLICITPS
jgi:hypothetical protein